MVHPDDVALLISHSGESEELIRLLMPLRSIASKIVALTSQSASTLARGSDAAVVYGPITEACPLSLAPSTSTTVMIALGDAIAFTLSELREFTSEQFAAYHPAGTLGRKLATVESCMRQGPELRFARVTDTVRQVFAQARHTGRRTGAIMILDESDALCGLFTDSDLARLFEHRADALFDQPISQVMTRAPITIPVSTKMSDAVELLRTRKISELPVVDAVGKPLGLLDITDVIGLETSPITSVIEKRPILRVIGPDAP
jgi:arabinose-5-phosphate isomerase